MRSIRPWAAWPGDGGPHGPWQTASPRAVYGDEPTPDAPRSTDPACGRPDPGVARCDGRGDQARQDDRADLVVLSVVEPHNLHLPGGAARRVDQERDRLAAGAQAIVQQARDSGVRATYLIWEGDPAEAILEASRSEDVDVIILGSRPRTNLRRMILGSVSSEVLGERPAAWSCSPADDAVVPPDGTGPSGPPGPGHRDPERVHMPSTACPADGTRVMTSTARTAETEGWIMNGRLQKLGIVLAVMGLAFVVGGGYTLYRTNQGADALQAFSAAQNVTLAYDDQGVLGGDDPEEAAAIMSLLVNDWGYCGRPERAEPERSARQHLQRVHVPDGDHRLSHPHGSTTVVLDEPGRVQRRGHPRRHL